VLPDDYLDSLSINDRLPWWEERLRQDPDPREVVVVVELDTPGAWGFARCRAREGSRRTAELGATYLSAESWGQGLGRARLTLSSID
jgi:hypothetical protein